MFCSTSTLYTSYICFDSWINTKNRSRTRGLLFSCYFLTFTHFLSQINLFFYWKFSTSDFNNIEIYVSNWQFSSLSIRYTYFKNNFNWNEKQEIRIQLIVYIFYSTLSRLWPANLALNRIVFLLLFQISILLSLSWTWCQALISLLYLCYE